MGEHISVDSAGLLSHAGVCDTAAAAIQIPAPSAAGHLTQATTAAVAHGHALIDAKVGEERSYTVPSGATVKVTLVKAEPYHA